MILAAAALAAAQMVTMPSGDGLSVDQRIELLSASASRGTTRIERMIYDDPAMRAEIRRVGFAKGCDAATLAGREVRDRHAQPLQAAFAAAIRAVIPTQVVAEARPLTFLAGRLSSYDRRVQEELGRSAAPLLAEIGEDMRRTFLARIRSMPETSDEADNRVVPRPDIAAALGIGEHWDLDNPNHVAMACIEQRIPAHLRPTITTGPAPQ